MVYFDMEILSEIKRLWMVQLPSEKFNVAWFKLAEFVGRKEKERAFALFRLLVHALPDAAFAAQLEGDLFLAFKDERAVDAYKRSAGLYEESGRFLEAATLYERMVIPQSPEFFKKLLFLYNELAHEPKMAHCATNLVRVLLDAGSRWLKILLFRRHISLGCARFYRQLLIR
jgi:tetratricopeptide (TPR) repeat protein